MGTRDDAISGLVWEGGYLGAAGVPFGCGELVPTGGGAAEHLRGSGEGVAVRRLSGECLVGNCSAGGTSRAR